MDTINTPSRLYDVCYVRRARQRRTLPSPAPRFIAYAKEVGADEYVIPFINGWKLGTREEAINRAERLRRRHRGAPHHV